MWQTGDDARILQGSRSKDLFRSTKSITILLLILVFAICYASPSSYAFDKQSMPSRVAKQLDRALQENKFAEAVSVICECWKSDFGKKHREVLDDAYWEVITDGIVLDITNSVPDKSVKPPIAVLEFTTVMGRRSFQGCDLSDRVESALVRTGRFVVVERKKMSAIIEEKEFNNTVDAAPSTSRAGPIAPAEILVTGTLGPSVHVKAVNVSSGKVVASSVYSRPEFHLEEPDRKLIDNLGVSIWTDKPHYSLGENVIVYARVQMPCWLKILSLEPDGSLVQVYPNDYSSSGKLDPDTTVTIGQPGSGFQLKLTPPAGEHKIIGVATANPIKTLSYSVLGTNSPQCANPEEIQQILRDLEYEISRLNPSQHTLLLHTILSTE